jgi:hypothetical protein
MMASELVKILQGLIEQEGDCRVYAAIDFDDISGVSVHDGRTHDPVPHHVPKDDPELRRMYAEMHQQHLERHPTKEFWLES